MKEAFNRNRVEFFLNMVNNTYHLKNLITERDIYEKKAYKKIKSFINEPSGKGLQSIYLHMTLYSTIEKIEEMIKRFFPTKFESVKRFVEQGGNYKTLNFMWHPSDEKVHWSVVQFYGETPGANAEQRDMKLKTDLYLERTEEERKQFLLKIKTCLDELYGYYIEFSPTGEWFITDRNMVKEGLKKIVKGVGDTISFIQHSNKFCREDFTTQKLIYA